MVSLLRACLLSLAVAVVMGCAATPEPLRPPASAAGAVVVRPTGPAAPTPQLPQATDIASAGGIAFEGTFAVASMVVSAGKAWIAGIGDGIGVLDRSGRLARSVAVAGACDGMDTGFGAIWTATCDPGGIVRMDPGSGAAERARLDDPIRDSPASIGAGEGAIWLVAGAASDQLLGIDPNTLEVAIRDPIPPGGEGVRAGFGGVWVTCPGADQVLRVDATSGQSVSIHVAGGPRFIALGAGAVWILGRLGTVTRLDPATNTVTATIPLDSSADGGIAVGGGRVWVRGGSALLTAIDAATNKVVARYGPSSGAGTVAADDDAVWATAPDVAMIWRLPLR